jgi:hypothetical protein
MAVIKSLTEGFRFALSLKRMAPYFILYLVIFSLLTNFLFKAIDIMMGRIGLFLFFASMGIYVIIFIILTLVALWVNGAILDQAKYPTKKPIMKSLEYSASRFLTMLAAIILYVILAMIISSIPIIGGILAFLYSLAFFYIYSAIIIDGTGVIDAFRRSWFVFRKYPLETFATWFLAGIISVIIVGVFLLPMLFYMIGGLMGSFQGLRETLASTPMTGEIFRTRVMPRVIEVIYSPYFVPYFIIACIGLSFQTIFVVGTQARLYINLKKGKPSSEE